MADDARKAVAEVLARRSHSADGLLETARRLRSRIAERAPEIDRERRLPSDLVEDLRAAGFFSLVLPEAFGGLGLDPVTANQAVEEISVADGSAGWCMMIALQNQGMAGYLPDEHIHEIWGGGQIVAGTARPIGRAVTIREPAGGYIVSGRWPFASGSSHADWFVGECVVYDGDEPRRDAEGNEVTRAVFVPRDAVTIHDTWDTTGLRGTASNDFSVDGAFVPAARGLQMLVTPPLQPSPLYQALCFIFVSHGSQALGVARAAVETAIQIANTKRGWGNTPLCEVPRIQVAIAEATALVESARTFLYATTGELWQALEEGGADARELARLRARVRLATSHAAQASVRAVDTVHGAVPTSAIFKTSPLERHFRDIHSAAAHVMIGPMTYEAAGRVELGMEPAFPFF
jgi:alkylation response protein AidB-like acyl-CoA dehydrogenase